MSRTRRGRIACLLLVMVLPGCGGRTATKPPSVAVQREVAGHFAAALLRGDAQRARALLAPGSDGALGFLVQQAVAPWKGERASFRLPARRDGIYWTVSFARRRTKADGSFERQRGDLVMSVAPTPAGASVAFFAFENLLTRFSTHRDSQLLPSKR